MKVVGLFRKDIIVAIILVFVIASDFELFAQNNSERVKIGLTEQIIPVEKAVTKHRDVTVNGVKIPYEVTVGTLPVFGPEGKPNATLLYTYYRRTDISDIENRPLMFSFNGGPGAASLWMHLGFTSPKRLKVSDEGFPIQPYGVVDNNYSVIDVTDIVYVNPVNTGFSRMVNEGKPEDFFGVQEDLAYLSDWIGLFLSRYNRWTSPKFLIGESYGSTRVAGLAGKLQDSYNIFVNGVIMHSQCGMGLPGTITASLAGINTPLTNIFKLSHYTATAWYFKQLSPELQNRKLEDLLSEVEGFMVKTYIPAVILGGALNEQERSRVAATIARYSGLTEKFVLNNNLSIPASLFWKEILREKGLTVGHLDTRYVGIDSRNSGTMTEYSPEYDSWAHSFTPAINAYLRDDLGFNTELEYFVGGQVGPWNYKNGITLTMLQKAMQQNPSLRVLNQQGYYDGMCDPFGAKYALWQLDSSGTMKDRIMIKEYHSGHMIYLRKDMLAESTKDLRDFIKNSIPVMNQPIQYKIDTVDLTNYDE